MHATHQTLSILGFERRYISKCELTDGFRQALIPVSELVEEIFRVGDVEHASFSEDLNDVFYQAAALGHGCKGSISGPGY